MKEENKISVVINTYNAEKHLQMVLDALKSFDEIIICDMESTDRTTEIAQQNKCHLIIFPKGNYRIVEPARQFAINHAKYPWIFVVDADEIVPSSLHDYLYIRIQDSQCPEGIMIPRKNYFMGHFMHASYPDYILRFFKKEKCQWPSAIHSSPDINGRIEKISKKRKDLAFIHLANDTISTILHKNNIYSDYEVIKRKNKHYGIWALFFRPGFRFFKSYFLKGGCLDGRPGLIHAILDAIYQFSFVAKFIEKNNTK